MDSDLNLISASMVIESTSGRSRGNSFSYRLVYLVYNTV